jgi:S-disulfanyl-L-cysteine oxidoreductase SoxD
VRVASQRSPYSRLCAQHRCVRKANTASDGLRPLRRSLAGISIDRYGNNLPPGSGSASRGREIFDQQCAACHGAKGEGGIGDRLVGGQGTLATSKPVRTVGSYWPYAPTLFDYIRRAMPQNAPQSLSNEDVYAVSAYILHLNGLLPEDATLDAKALGAIKMPNRNMFVGDSRPDVKDRECMTGCRGGM